MGSGISAYETDRVSGGREDFWPIVAIKGAKMGQKSGPGKKPAEQVVKEIRRATRRQFSAEEKIRIVLTGLRGEDSIAELCRREGIVENLYYRWSKEFLEAGKKRLAGDTARAATSDEVRELRREAGASDPEQTRYSASDFLSLVRPVQQERAGSLKRSAAPSGSAVEPHSGRGARKRDPAGA